MKIKPNLHKAAELGISLTALSVLILAGCGGGGSSSSTPTSTPVSITPTTSTIVPFKGKFSNGSIVLKDANGNIVTLLNNTGVIGSNGTATVTFAGASLYPLVVEVTGTYQNEVTGANETSNTPMRSFIPDVSTATAASGVPVTAVTEIAVTALEKKIGGSLIGMKAASAVAEFGAAETMLGLPAGFALQSPVFDATGKTSDANTLKLVALAVSAETNGAGVGLVAKLKAMATDIANMSPISTPSANPVLAGLPVALSTITTGASSVMPAGATAPVGLTFIVPASSVQAIQSAIASSTTTMVANSTAADNYIATASSSGGGLREFMVTGEPISGFAAINTKKCVFRST